MNCILAGSQRTPRLETWWDPSPEERGWAQPGRRVAVCRALPPGCSSAWNRAHVGQWTHCISVSAGFQLPHAPRGPAALPGDGTASSAGAPHPCPASRASPSPPSSPACTTKPCPCALLPIAPTASPPLPGPATGARTHHEPGEPVTPPGHTHRPAAVPCFPTASRNWRTKRNVSKHGPHLAPSRPKFHQVPKRGCWRAEAVSLSSVFTYEFQPKRRQRCRRPPTPRGFSPLKSQHLPPLPAGEQLPTSRVQVPSAQSFFLPS